MRRGINTFDLEAGRVENMEGRMEKGSGRNKI